MLNGYTFGCGQGASKAMIHAINNGVLDPKFCKIVNSTQKDIPSDYQNDAIIISDDPDAGCGKVRDSAKKLMARWLKINPNAINDIIFNEDNPIDYVNIIATTEGASGSGASVVLAKYINTISEENNIDILVNIILITGFESDTRGLQNTINYFKDLNGADYTIRVVSNKKYLKNSATIFEAEEKANDEIASVLNIIGRANIIDSDHNIDDTDHFRLLANPGLLFTGEVNMGDQKYKNIDQLNKEISDMIDYTSSLDFKPSASKIGIYMNISEDNMNSVDTSFDVIKKKLCDTDCIPELFIHKQYDGSNYQFIRVVASGISLPIDELQKMYSKYMSNVEALNKADDNFFDQLNQMDTNKLSKSDSKVSTNSMDNFFSEFESEENDETSKVMRRTNRSKQSSTKETKFRTRNMTTNNVKPKEYSEDNIDKY